MERRKLRKRHYGVGSIYQRSSDGLWCGVISVAGRQKRLYGKTSAEVGARLAAVRTELGKGRLPAGRAALVADFLRRWLATSVKPRVRPLTYAGYIGGEVQIVKIPAPTNDTALNVTRDLCVVQPRIGDEGVFQVGGAQPCPEKPASSVSAPSKIAALITIRPG